MKDKHMCLESLIGNSRGKIEIKKLEAFRIKSATTTKSNSSYIMPKISIIAPLTKDTGYMTKVDNIHALLFAQVIFDGDLSIHEATDTTPKISAVVPKIACDHTSTDSRMGSSPIA